LARLVVAGCCGAALRGEASRVLLTNETRAINAGLPLVGVRRDTERMNRRLRLFAAIALLATVGAVRADELTLKDGSKISGTIVGYEGNSFKVKTSYGFAVVRKDQIASIRMTESAGTPAAAKPTASAESKTVTPAKSANAQASIAPSSVPSVAIAAPRTVATTPALRPASAPASAVAPTSASVSSVSAAAPAPAAPPPIREEVSGNNYVNETYGFSMYKPPDWELIAGARSILPGAITALGTDDQTTYLLIGEDPANKSIESQMKATLSRLADIMDNFQPLGEIRIDVSGSHAIERRFHGMVDQHDWSGVVVLVPRGPQVFTIFGMTYAETDLVQIQENVISRAISSIEFARR
jgi:hypothetical protein